MTGSRRVRDILSSRARPVAVAYGLAVLFVLATVAIRLALEPVFAGQGTYIPFVLPVALAAWAGGFGPGLLATVVSVLLASLVLPRADGGILGGAYGAQLVAVVFIVGGILISFLASGLRQGRARAEHHAHQAQRLQAVTGALSGELSARDAAQAVLREGLQALGAGSGVIALRTPDGSELRVVAAVGYDPAVIERYATFSVDDQLPISEAVRTGRPIVIHETEEMRRRYPAIASTFREQGTAVVVPLLDASGPIGGLFYRFLTIRPHGPADDEYLLALGSLCASAIERANLHDAERKAAARAAFLARASAALGASLDIEETAGRIADLLVPEIADVASIHVLEPEGDIRLLALGNAEPSVAPLLERLQATTPPRIDDATGTGAIIRTGEERYVEVVSDAMLDASTDDPEVREILRELAPVSYLAVPLTVRGRTIGSISLLSLAASGRRFDEADRVLARQLAERAATATENAQLYGDLLAREAQQAAVARLGQLALELTDLEPLFDATVRELATVLDVEYTKILRLVPGGDQLELVAGVGWRAGLVGTATVSAGPGSQAGYTLATGGPVVVADLRRETRFDGPPLLTEHGVVSGMSTVIAGHRGHWGVLGIHTTARRTFGGDDTNFLSAVANVLAGAIERRRRLDEERTAQELGRAFIGVVSHELRTPITTIYGGAKILARLPAGDPSAPSLAADVEADAERLYRLTEDLLVMTRLERRDLEIGREPVLLSRLLERVARSEQQRWPEVRFEVAVGPDVQPVAGEDNYVEQVVRNLLGNAAKYSPAGTRVELRAERLGDEMTVRVLDQGPGIRHEDPDRLFALFYRSPSTAQQASGAGIGLFVCSQLVRAMGGRLWARQRPEGGAEFGFALQRYVDPDDLEEDDDDAEPAPATDQPVLTILRPGGPEADPHAATVRLEPAMPHRNGGSGRSSSAPSGSEPED